PRSLRQGGEGGERRGSRRNAPDVRPGLRGQLPDLTKCRISPAVWSAWWVARQAPNIPEQSKDRDDLKVAVGDRHRTTYRIAKPLGDAHSITTARVGSH